jgi:hypothetical protein
VDFDPAFCFLSDQAVLRTPWPPPSFILAVSDSSSVLTLGAPRFVSPCRFAHYFCSPFTWSIQSRPDFHACRPRSSREQRRPGFGSVPPEFLLCLSLFLLLRVSCSSPFFSANNFLSPARAEADSLLVAVVFFAGYVLCSVGRCSSSLRAGDRARFRSFPVLVSVLRIKAPF